MVLEEQATLAGGVAEEAETAALNAEKLDTFPEIVPMVAEEAVSAAAEAAVASNAAKTATSPEIVPLLVAVGAVDVAAAVVGSICISPYQV